MAKEKIYFKRLPWSPKLVGQPVGPLKGACVGCAVLNGVWLACVCGMGRRRAGGASHLV